jgi:hypothetical protein
MKAKQKIFRILVVDDKKPVLQAIGDWIKPTFLVSDEEYKIELLKLAVNVVNDHNGYVISEETIANLYNYCDKPFQLILLDFGFVKAGLKAVDEIFRLYSLRTDKTLRQLVDEVVLNPSHLASQCSDESRYFKKLERNFINHRGKLIIYTYIPGKIEAEYTCADVRKNVTNKNFPNADIQVIDTRKELFNNSMFDKIYSDEKEYYPFLISKYLSKIIHIEIAESLLKDTQQIRVNLKRYRRNNQIITISTLIASLITGIFIPSIVSSIEKGDYITTVAFLIMLLMIIIIVTVGSKLLEKYNDKLLK